LLDDLADTIRSWPEPNRKIFSAFTPDLISYFGFKDSTKTLALLR